MKKIKFVFDLISNMGMRYVLFRVKHELLAKTGLLANYFPVNPKKINTISLEKWRGNLPPFFFYGKDIKSLKPNKTQKLADTYKAIVNNNFTFFSKEKFFLGKDYDWITNPITGYKYDINLHWSKIQDISETAGDIKFVWEKARFSFLMDVIRYDYHYSEDCSSFVFSEIESFIDANPINQGPNYKCSQEVSLRLINWTFALYYYKDAEHLTQELFDKIMNSIYWQIHHVYHNIHFSRIAVRNNHALTETLLLYISGLLFPFLPDVKKWSKKGKSWFEKEVAYQIYPDGTFLQYSMNYHRVAIQLLTLGIRISALNKVSFKDIVVERAKKSLLFLRACSDPLSGILPNYGNNDGALFFKFTDDDYRDYRSQLNDLDMVLNNKTSNFSEGCYWLGFENDFIKKNSQVSGLAAFENGGYYIFRDKESMTFIRCGAYKDRPSQSDNLHVDIWLNGQNVFRDSGTYKYNAEKQYLDYFNGSEGHNTIAVDKKNQMTKGGRFIWYHWVKKVQASLEINDNSFLFKGAIHAFKEINPNIIHKRIVKKKKDSNTWEIVDSIESPKLHEISLFWHLNPDFEDRVSITVTDDQENLIIPLKEDKWFSPYYGYKEPSLRYTYSKNTSAFTTIITIN